MLTPDVFGEIFELDVSWIGAGLKNLRNSRPSLTFDSRTKRLIGILGR